MVTRAVFFDFGGTLFVMKHHSALQLLLREEGREVDLRSIHAAYMKAEPWWLSVYGSGPTDPRATEDAYRALDARVVLELFPDETPSGADEFSRRAREKGLAIEEAMPSELYPDAMPLLAELKREGFLMGLISNATARTRKTVEATGLTDYLDPIVISAEVGCSKPNPEIFRIALAKSKTRAEEAIHVGDVYESDVVGARNAGMKGILIDREGLDRHGDCPRVSTLADVRRFT